MVTTVNITTIIIIIEIITIIIIIINTNDILKQNLMCHCIYVCILNNLIMLIFLLLLLNQQVLSYPQQEKCVRSYNKSELTIILKSTGLLFCSTPFSYQCNKNVSENKFVFGKAGVFLQIRNCNSVAKIFSQFK